MNQTGFRPPCVSSVRRRYTNSGTTSRDLPEREGKQAAQPHRLRARAASASADGPVSAPCSRQAWRGVQNHGGHGGIMGGCVARAQGCSVPELSVWSCRGCRSRDTNTGSCMAMRCSPGGREKVWVKCRAQLSGWRILSLDRPPPRNTIHANRRGWRAQQYRIWGGANYLACASGRGDGNSPAGRMVWTEEGIKVWIGVHRYPDACPATAPPRRRIVEVADVMGKQGSSHEMRRAGPCPALPCPALPCPAIEGGRGKADPNGRQRAMGWTCLTRGGELAAWRRRSPRQWRIP